MSNDKDPYFVPSGPLTVETITFHMTNLDFVATEVKHAFEMTDTTFKYKCPCKKGFHVHGNGGDPFTNRVEYRSSHCQFQSCIAQQKSKEPVELEIHITDETARKLITKKLKKQKSKSK